MPTRIVLEQVDEIDSVVELIKDDYANDYRKLWTLSERTIGIFLHESIGVLGGNVFSIMTILDYNPHEKRCELLIRYAGGALSIIGPGSSEDFIKRFVNAVIGLSTTKNWRYEVSKVKVKNAGSQCPNCGAAYRYPKEKIREDGTADCQNCGKPFNPTSSS